MVYRTLPHQAGRTGERHLAEFLLALAALLQRLRAHPRGHPSLEPFFHAAEQSLEAVLAGRELLRVEVGEVQLLVEGMGTNPEFEPLRELALRLRRSGVRALEFRRGITPAELLEVLGALVTHTGRGSVVRLSGPHLALHAAPRPDRSPEEAWLALGQAILEDPFLADPADPIELATGLELHSSDPLYDRAVLDAMEAAARAPLPDGALTRLVAALPAATLRRLFSPRGDWEIQRAFLAAAPDGLPASLVIRLLITAADVRGRPLAPATQRLLAKLARLAASSAAQVRTEARLAVAVETRRALADLDDRPGVREQPPLSLAAEPERLLKLSLESGILEAGTLVAVDRMIARRQVSPLLSLLDTVPREDPVARALRAGLYHPRTVRVLLEANPPDLDALDRLVPACGIEAAPALLEALATARERRVRLRLLDLASRYGDAIGPLARERLQGMPWYVQRNLLHLIGRLPNPPHGLELDQFLRHQDSRVRHEAVALLIHDPLTRERGLAEGIASRQEATVRLALAALADHCPPALAEQVMTRLAERGWSEETRAMAVTAIAPVRELAVLRLLRRLVVARNLVGLGRLAPKSPVMLAALRGLATYWAQERGVPQILAAARESRDPEVREAARNALARRTSGAAARGGVGG